MPSFNGFIVDKLNHLGGIWQQTTWSKISCLIFQFLNLWRQSWCAEKKREVPFVIFISFLNFSWFYWHSTPVVGTILCMKMNIRSQWFLKKIMVKSNWFFSKHGSHLGSISTANGVVIEWHSSPLWMTLGWIGCAE